QQLADVPEQLAASKVVAFAGFHEGLARFRVRHPDWPNKDDLFGWMNTHGEVVVRPMFHGGGHFANGVAPAGIRDGLWGYIDTHGEPADWPDRWTLPQAGSISEGVAQFGDDPVIYFDGDEFSTVAGPKIAPDEPL